MLTVKLLRGKALAAELRDLDEATLCAKITLPFQCEESSPTNRVSVAEVDVIVGHGLWKIGQSDAHYFRRLHSSRY